MKDISISIQKKVFELFRMIPLYECRCKEPNIDGVLIFVEKLNEVGYMIAPKQIKELLYQENATFSNTIRHMNEILGDVLVKPMYPDFPTVVPTMDERKFRYDQMMHYATTYGADLVTDLFGVDLGIEPYMPKDTPDTEKTVSDKQLLEVKTIEFLIIGDALDFYKEVVHRIIGKRERMTEKEIDLLNDILNAPGAIVESFFCNVPFKENLIPIANAIMASDKKYYAKALAISGICDHPGDVFKVLDTYLATRNWKLRTTEKRTFTHALCYFSDSSFAENVMRSNDVRERSLKMLKAIDFNTYVRNPLHGAVYVDLMSKKLRSWYSDLEKNIDAGNKEVVRAMLCKRPTEYFRRMNRLLKLGYDPVDIANDISNIADKIPVQTIVSAYNSMNAKKQKLNDEKNELIGRPASNTIDMAIEVDKIGEIRGKLMRISIVMDILFSVLGSHFEKSETPFKNKKVFMNLGVEYNVTESRVIIDKSQESGYIRPGISYRIPEECKIMRFFCYWDNKDTDRVDLDLHTYMIKHRESTDDGSIVHSFEHVGWNGDYSVSGVYTSGDITRAPGAEYIDVVFEDAEKCGVDYIAVQIDSFTGMPFKDIDTAFTGAMAVSSGNSTIKLYDSKNCFWYNNLNSDSRILDYAIIDIKNRCITFVGADKCNFNISNRLMSFVQTMKGNMNLPSYLATILAAQDVKFVKNKEDADVVLVMGKPESEKDISVMDNNFFMDM